jgi:hypothetical protein
MRRLLLTVFAVLAALPATALAAWTAPVTISAPHTFASNLRTLVLSSGTQVAAWTFQDGIGAAAPAGSRFTVRPAGGAYGDEHRLPAGFLDLGGYGQTRLLALSLNGDAVQVAFGDTAGMGSLRTIVHGDVRYLPHLAVDTHGRAVVGWIQGASGNRRQVRVSTRAPGGSFSAPSTLVGTGRADDLAVGVSSAGTVVALERSGRLLARVRRTGHNWGSLQDLGPAATGTENDIQAQVNVSGRVQVVWRHRQLTEGGDDGLSFLESAYMPAGSGRFHSATRVETSGAGAPTLVPVGRNFAVAYSQVTSAGVVARLRELTPSVGPARDSAPAGGLTDVGVSVNPAAGYNLTWMVPQPGGDDAGQGFFAPVPFGQSPQPAQAVTPSENVQELLTNPTAGGPDAVWIARPSGTGPGIPLAQIKTVVRAADSR